MLRVKEPLGAADFWLSFLNVFAFLNPKNDGDCCLKKLLHRLYFIAFFTSYSVFSILVTCSMLFCSHSLDSFTDTMIIALPALIGAFKLVVMAVYYRNICDIVLYIRSELKPFVSQKWESLYFNCGLLRESFMMCTFFPTGLFVCVVYTVENLFMDIKTSKSSIFHQVYLPQTLIDSLGWYLTAWQVLELLMIGYACSSYDVTFVSIVSTLLCHFEILHRNIKEIADSSQPHLRLQWCILYNQKISRCVKEVNKIARPIMLLLVIFSSTFICVTLYQLAAVPLLQTGYMTFCNHIAMIISGLLELSILCWFGNEIKVRSQSVAQLIYTETPWYEAPPGIRKLYLMSIQGSQKEFILAEHLVFTMTLDTFLSVIQASFSFFSVLKGLK